MAIERITYTYVLCTRTYSSITKSLSNRIEWSAIAESYRYSLSVLIFRVYIVCRNLPLILKDCFGVLIIPISADMLNLFIIFFGNLSLAHTYVSNLPPFPQNLDKTNIKHMH